MADPPHLFRIDHSRAVLDAAKQLQQKAITRGIGNEFNEALLEIIQKLRDCPTQWGDPQFNLKFMQMVVYRGIRSPLQVSYAVNSEERLVILRQVLPLPGTVLADS